MANSEVSILCTGSELLDGRIVDTNTNLIIHRLQRLGVLVRQSLCCRDSASDITNNLAHLSKSARVLIVSGGLGPTSDDITRDVIAAFCGKPLVQDNQALVALKALYEKRRRKFEQSNAKQALFPEGATIIANPIGTAPGFALTFNDVLIISVPGVPKELAPMIDASVLPLVAKHLGHTTPPESKVFRIFGLSEAKIGELVESDKVPEGVQVSYRASFPEIFVRLTTDEKDGRLDRFASSIESKLGVEHIVSYSELGGFESYLQELLLSRQHTLAAAESCTGGLVSRLMTETPGASACFLGGVVTYSNASKQAVLAVPESVFLEHGAVSHECAKAMAVGARLKMGASIAVSITGIAGPDGGTAEKPVGTFYIGLASAEAVESFHCFLNLERSWFRSYAAFTALDVVRRHILGLPPIHQRIRADGV
jgi:nicotinamide-nucleotide amidase